MSTNGRPPYELKQMPGVSQQIKELGKKAVAKGINKQYVEALKMIVASLRSDPTGWGDPEYRMHKPGAWMYHGTYSPLFVQYVVYENERVVLLRKVIPLPLSPLA
jgi:hypothetical protein